MEGLRIRPGHTKDIAGVVALERATPEAPHWAESEYVAAIAGDSAIYVRRCLFVAEMEHELIGFAVGKIVGDLAELESIAVELTARRHGAGRALCGAVIDSSRQHGATVVELEVRAASEGAVGLYRGLGFVSVGRRRGYYSDPADDALLMRLDL
jgi:ribosomal-protein-alanine N-acetyltransferase